MPTRDSPPHRTRSRSPRRRRDDDYGRSRSPRRGGAGGGGGGGRERDAGWGGPVAVKEEYTAADRERERAADRKRYEDGAGGEVDRPKSPPKPNFSNSGILAKESNTVKGVALKYHEPPEARKPVQNWRLYVFKGEEQVDLIHIYHQSCYLVGRDAVVTDIPVAHPSCSKQHAAFQFRLIATRNEFGDEHQEVKPFIIDLESTNGTYVNGKEIPTTRYYELRNSDVIKFGTSSREYVLLREDSK